MKGGFSFKLLFLVSLLVVFLLNLAYLSSAVLSSNSAVLDVSLIMPVNFSVLEGGTLSYLDIDFVMVPLSDFRQSVLSSSYNVEPVSFSDGSVNFRLYDPVDTVIRADFKVQTLADGLKVNQKVLFPISNLDPAFFKFISSSDVYDIDEDITNLALSLAGDEDDLFVVVFNLANWVNRNVVYDLETVSPEVLSASWVLENRRGVCTEYTSLFVALARSLGIPAREVSGFAFTESSLFERGWEFHSWAEVYFPGFGWILFDPTYGQYGFIDAGHVKLGTGVEGELVRNSFSWRGRDVDVLPGQASLLVDVVSTQGLRAKSNFDVSLSVFEEEVGRDSYNFLRIDLFNNNPFYVAENLRVSGVDGLQFLSNRHKSVVLAPFESKSIYVVFKVRRDLSQNFIYTFPLRFYLNDELFSTNFKARDGSTFISEGDVLIFLDEEKRLVDSLSCTSSKIIDAGDFLEINCASVSSSGFFCFGEFCSEVSAFEPLFLSVQINDSGIFSRSVHFKSESGDVKTGFVKFLSLDLASFDLSNTTHSKSLSSNDIGFINVSLVKTSSSVPYNVSLKIKHDYFVEEISLGEVSDSFLFSFTFPYNSLKRGLNEVDLKVQYVDVLGREFNQSKIVEISVENLSLLDEIDFFFRKIYFWFKNLRVFNVE